jgi:hypothetical protein
MKIARTLVDSPRVWVDTLTGEQRVCLDGCVTGGYALLLSNQSATLICRALECVASAGAIQADKDYGPDYIRLANTLRAALLKPSGDLPWLDTSSTMEPVCKQEPPTGEKPKRNRTSSKKSTRTPT